MSNKFIATFFLALFISCDSFDCFAKKSKIDSLTNVVKYLNDTNKVNALNSLSVAFADTKDYKKAINYALQAKLLAEKLKSKRHIASSLINIGNIYFNQGNYSMSIVYNLKALRIAEELDLKKTLPLIL